MQRRYSVTSQLKFSLYGLRVDLDDYPLEVSLDCHVCGRCHRTIEMSTTGKPMTVQFTAGYSYTISNNGLLALCTPTGHEYPGRIESARVLRFPHTHLKIVFTGEFEPFHDPRYGIEAKDECGWARISFGISCLWCGKRYQHSTQTNLVRPTGTKCACGMLLFEDIGPPLIASLAIVRNTPLPHQQIWNLSHRFVDSLNRETTRV